MCQFYQSPTRLGLEPRADAPTPSLLQYLSTMASQPRFGQWKRLSSNRIRTFWALTGYFPKRFERQIACTFK